MPIYEFYCPDNHTVYQFYAKTLAQGRTVPKCPDNPAYRMQKLLSPFAITGRAGREEPKPDGNGGKDGPDDARMEAAMGAMEREFADVDENDPRAMARMMRRMSELSGEKLDGGMEEMVRKLEEGADPDSLEEEMGGMDEPGQEEGAAESNPKEGRHRWRALARPPRRDPRLHDYE